MGNSVDKRVVQLEFDNAQFESGVKSSLNSLEELNHKLSFDNIKTSGLDKFSESLSSGKLSGLASHFNPIISKISEVGAVASTAFSGVGEKLTSSFGGFMTALTGINAGIGAIALQGGIKRALNIEQAEFMLKNLGVNVEKVMEDVSYAVDGTRFGLDEAAVAASSLSASGVKAGDDMKTALRGISGVATMTNAEYSEMARIFTAVAGQGKVMTIQLRQMELRGLNGAAAIANYLDQVEGLAGVTEAEVRDMVTQGVIDFETFAAAMDWAFGEGATKANETFTGALANVKAALARIGEKFVTPVMDGLRRIFVELIPNINNLKDAITPLADAWGIAFVGMADAIALLLKGWDKSHIVQAIGWGIKLVADIVYTAGKLVVKGITLIGKAVNYIINVFAAIGGIVFDPLVRFATLVDKVFGEPIRRKIANFRDTLVNFFKELLDKIENLEPTVKSAEEIRESMKKLAESLDFLKNIAKVVGAVALTPLVLAFKLLKDAVFAIPDIIERAKNKLIELGLPIDQIGSFVHLANEGLKEFFDLFENGIPDLETASEYLDKVKTKFGEWKEETGEKNDNFLEHLKEYGKLKLNNFLDKAKTKVSELNTRVVNFGENTRTALTKLELPSGLDGLSNVVIDLIELLPKLATKLDELGFPFESVTSLMGLAYDGLFDFLGLFSDGLPNMEQLTGFLDKMSVKFDEWKETSSVAFESFAESFKVWAREKVEEVFDKLIIKLDELKENIGDLPQYVSDIFSSFGVDLSFTGIIDSFFEGLSNAIEYLTGAEGIFSGADLGSLGTSIAELVNTLMNGDSLLRFSENISTAGEHISTGVDKIKTSGSDFKTALEDFKEGLSTIEIDRSKLAEFESAAVIVLLVVGALYTLQLVGDIGRQISKWSKPFGDLGLALSKFGRAAQQNAVFDGILKLSISMWILSKVPAKSLAKSLIALALASGILVLVVKQLSKIFDTSLLDAKEMTGMAMSVAGIASSVLILAIACRLFANVPIKGMVKAGVALVALVSAVTLLALVSKKFSRDLGNLGFTMLQLSSGLLLLGVACTVFTFVPIYGMLKAAVALSVFIAAAALLSKISSKTGSFVKLALSMSVMAFAMSQIAIACLLFTVVPTNGMIKAAAALGVLVVAIGLLAAINSLSGGISSLGPALASMAGSLIIVALACLTFQTVSVESMLKAASALVVLIGSLVLLSTIKAWKAGSMELMVGMIIKLSAAMVIMAAAGLIFNMVSWGSVAKGLLSFVVVLGVFLAVSAAIGYFAPISAGMITLVACLEGLASAMLMGAGAITLFAVGLTLLGLLGPTAILGIVASLGLLLDGLIELAPKLSSAIEALIRAICTAFVNSAAAVADAAGTLIEAMFEGMLNHVPRIGDLAVAIILTFIMKIQEWSEVIIQAGIDLALNFINGLANGLRDNTERADLAVENLANACVVAFATPFTHLPFGIGDWIDENIVQPADEKSQEAADKFDALGTNATQNWIDSVMNAGEDSKEGGFNLLEMFKSGVEDSSSELPGMGSDIASLFTGDLNSGIEGGITDLQGTFDQYGSMIPDGFDQSLSNIPNIGSESISSLVDSIGGKDAQLFSESKQAGEQIPKGFDSGSTGIDKKIRQNLQKGTSVIKNYGRTFNSSSKTMGKNIPSGVDSGSSTTKDKVRKNVSGVPGVVKGYSWSANQAGYQVGANIAFGMQNGINAYASRVAEASAAMVRRANDAAKKESKEGSPSRVMYQKGVWYAQGFINGMKALYGDVARTSGGMVGSAIDSTVEGFGELASFMDGIDYNPTIRPVFDGSQLESGIRNANRLMVQNQMLSAGYAGRSYPTFSATDASNGYTNNIQIALNYDAGADANQIMRDLGMALRSRNIMEG